MEIGDKVFYIENRTVKEAEVIKITRDFVTLKYKTNLPNTYRLSYESTGGIRIRRSRVFQSKEEAKKSIDAKR